MRRRVPKQVIQETTGHRSSDGIKAYEWTSSSLKRKRSELLQGSFCEANMDEEWGKMVPFLSPLRFDEYTNNSIKAIYYIRSASHILR